MSKIKVDGLEIQVTSKNEIDFISLSDMVANHQDGTRLIEKWFNVKNTLEYLGAWETLHNPNFNSPEFGGIRNEAGSNRFYISTAKWIEKTGAVGIYAKVGRYGGTFAHKDIAFHFGMYISPLFNLLLIKEFQRLKDEEERNRVGGWDFKRYLTKVNYKFHTDAVKSVLVPLRKLPKQKEGVVYAEEADLIYFAMFGITSKEWRQNNPTLSLEGLNIRDVMNTHQLIVLANLETLNSAMLNSGTIDARRRLEVLSREAITQFKALENSNLIEHTLVESPKVPGKPNNDGTDP